MNPRSQATRILQQVIRDGVSLTACLEKVKIDAQDKALVQQLCYGVLRLYWRLGFIVNHLLEKPLKDKDQDIFLLLLIGLYQLSELHIPRYAATKETVNACVDLKKPWAKSLINAVMRQYLRQEETLTQAALKKTKARLNHPTWLINKISQDWPEHDEAIFKANNEKAPMSLRVNTQKISEKDYLALLSRANIHAHKHPVIGITLDEAVTVQQLPKFAEGFVSVQDPSAQLAASLLDVHGEHRILDACAAPGGKTTHLLELAPKAFVSAIDIEEKRLARVNENLTRLQFKANVICGNAKTPKKWWDQIYFDRILLDAPCSATGVIRRHPDIKFLRRADDIKALQKQQISLVKTLLPLLNKGGKLLYCTCSIMPDENDQIIEACLKDIPNLHSIPIEANWGHATKHGRQVLPGENAMDGFYYCLLKAQF